MAAVECPGCNTGYLAGLPGVSDEVAHARGFIPGPRHVVEGAINSLSSNGDCCCDWHHSDPLGNLSGWTSPGCSPCTDQRAEPGA